ncbi:MAG: molybdopterin-dependent oxidoreductase [Planctomycetes bacterium]|nr:molybdopterin-dependent oxidoreductase [Planctomycetota bacterium]
MDLNRRNFLGCSAFLGVTPMLLAAQKALAATEPADGAGLPYRGGDPNHLICSVCLGCNTGCPTKVRIDGGAIAKIDGSPITPWTRMPFLPYKSSLQEIAATDGVLCPKGQAGIMTVYDPYRIRKVLKRAGPRGSMKWISVDFHTAVREIVHGGKLFAHVPGEENRHVEGYQDLYALKDAKLAGEMSKAVDEIWHLKTPEEKKAKIAAFKTQFKDHLHLLIDPEHPDLGPKNNQFLWIHGRLKGGRGDFFSRFVKDSFGSANYHGHTTVCQGALYFAGKAMSEQYAFDEKKKKADWTGGDKFFWQADQSSARFILFVGASPFEAGYPPLRTPNLTTRIQKGELKIAVVDPRFSKTAAKAAKWVPARPGSEGALALGMIRWMLENERIDRRYLLNANKAAATADGEPTWTNGCWLVKLKDGKPGEFLHASEIGLPKEKRTVDLKGEKIEYDFDPFVVLDQGKPVAFDPNDANVSAQGDLYADTELNGIRVKTALQLLRDEACKHTIAEWAGICGIAANDIVELASEISAYGKRGVVDVHRGVSQHTNGIYNCMAFNAINLLLGNYDWRGGFVKAATYDTTGGKAGKPFNFKDGMHAAKAKPFGLGLLREKKWEETSLFSGTYPARRPWFPNATDVYQELIPSVEDAYPYPIKALLLYMGSPVYSNPAGHLQAQILSDVRKLPLFVASDITIGESSMFADYIFPDLSFYERWEFHGSHPNNIWKVQPVRQPAIAPIPETVTVFGEQMPISIEAFMLAVAEELKLPGYGADGLGPGIDFKRPEDLYVRMVADLAFGEKADGSDAVPEASAEELAIFENARRHLPASVFDLAKWKAIAGENWKRVVYVLNRGGRYQDFDKAFDQDFVKNKYGKQVNLYCEKVAKTKNSMTGKSNPGLPTYLPIADCLGRPLVGRPEDLHLITHREIFHTKSRTAANPWLMNLLPENGLLLHPQDAEARGLKTGDLVRLVSDSNPQGLWELPNFGSKPMIGKVQVTEGIRPGVVTFSLGHGHWAYGSSDVTVDGRVIAGERKRGAGLHANAVMAVDPHLKNVALQDLVGGSVSFYDSPVRLVKEPT